MQLKEKYFIKCILLSYIEEQKFADEKFINEIAKIIIKKRHLEEYVQKVNLIDNPDDNLLGYYSYLNKEINICLPSKNMSVVEFNIKILTTLFHEFEHACQHKLYNEDNNSLKKQLLYLSLETYKFFEEFDIVTKKKLTQEEMAKYIALYNYYEKINNLYDKLYSYLPSERMATIDSLKDIIEILSNINNTEIKEKLILIKRKQLIEAITGYIMQKNAKSPLYVVYEELQKLQLNENIEFLINIKKIINNMTLEERLYYGFTIESSEYEEIIKEIVKM